MRLWSRLLGLVLVALLGLFGLAGGAWASVRTRPAELTSVVAKKSSPKKWVYSVCTSLGDWERKVRDLASSISSNLSGVTDLSQARGQLVTFLGNAVDATDTLLARLGDAGVPDVKNGDKIA